MYFWQSDGIYPTTLIDSLDVYGGDIPGGRQWGRTEVSGLGLTFQQGEEFHISIAVFDFPAYHDYLEIEATEDLALSGEHRSTVFADGQWQTLYEFWGVGHNLGIRACYNPAPGIHLEITPIALSDGEVNQPYYEALQVVGGSPPYDWDIVAGELPDGFGLNSATGIISGTPSLTSTGIHVFTVRVTDSDIPPNTDIQHLQLSIPYCVDADSDGFGDPEHPENTCPTDNCPSVYNPDQEDCDGDGIGDSCEVIRSWYVQSDGTGDAPTIQAAIDSCTNGDTVLVADGLYTDAGSRNLNLYGKHILLKSENGPEFTIIDCQGSLSQPNRAFTFAEGEDTTSIIDGFTIRGGYGPKLYEISSGGGMLVYGASPTVRNCVFTSNTAYMGGAVCVFGGSPRFENCTFIDNTATMGTAVFGILDANITLDNCLIAFNGEGHPVVGIDCDVVLSCCDVYGNAGGDWVGSTIAGQAYVNGNFSKGPLFCENSGDYTIDAVSPCAPDNNYCHALIGACGVACSDWRIVCDASILYGTQILSGSGSAKTAPGPGGWDIEVVPDYFQIHLTFCQPVDINIGNAADVYVDFNQDNVFDDHELCEAAVSHADRDPTRDITIRVTPDEDLDIESARVAVYSVGEYKLLGEAGQLIDYLDLNPTISGIGNQESLAAGGMTPLEFALGHSHPNPFNSTTVIPYSISDAGWVKLEIYDILGRRVKTLVNEIREAGQYEAMWDGTSSRDHPVPSGIYFYRLTSGHFAQARKMVLMK